MRLRNKKTGEIYEMWSESANLGEPSVIALFPRGQVHPDNKIYKYNSLAELSAEWEDYEEPKEYWFIDWAPEIGAYPTVDVDSDADERQKEIGNYFETKEEAEKAVEKLKAWKRLKDNGIRFNSWTIPEEPKTPHIKLVIEAEMDVPDSPYDLDLLFGGEE